MKIDEDVLVYGGKGEHDVFLFTANSTLKRNGALVMGAGCARAVRDRYLGCDMVFGSIVERHPHTHVRCIQYQGDIIGYFRTKEDWKKNSELHTLQRSVMELDILARKLSDYTFHLPMPAVNHGNMDFDLAMHTISGLPDNVHVYVPNKPVYRFNGNF